jgi:hypothetical protein
LKITHLGKVDKSNRREVLVANQRIVQDARLFPLDITAGSDKNYQDPLENHKKEVTHKMEVISGHYSNTSQEAD